MSTRFDFIGRLSNLANKDPIAKILYDQIIRDGYYNLQVFVSAAEAWSSALSEANSELFKLRANGVPPMVIVTSEEEKQHIIESYTR